MRKLSHDEIAENRKKPEQISDAIRHPLYALIDNVRSLYNVGSIFRSSDGALVRKLLLTGYTPAPPRREIDKTALGATLTVPWQHYQDPMDAVRELRASGVRLCAVELTDAGRPHYELQPADFPLCFAFGNELTGVSKDVMAAADMAVEIPMYGHKQSLNVAVAYGVVMYDAVRILRQGMRA
ncbi:MAG: RNA methyltransferase [Bacteroidetes bacterium]|nr:MAG: RNA methyltransferase [Bacteroidota bacterium]